MPPSPMDINFLYSSHRAFGQRVSAMTPINKRNITLRESKSFVKLQLAHT